MTPYVSLLAPPGNQTNLVGCGERQVTRELGKEDHPSWEVLTISLPEEVKTARQHRCTGKSGSMTQLNQYSMVSTGPKILGLPQSQLSDYSDHKSSWFYLSRWVWFSPHLLLYLPGFGLFVCLF